MKWKNVTTNLAAIVVYIQTIYPGLSYERIAAAWQNGTIWQHVFNLALMYLLAETGKKRGAHDPL